MPYYKVTLGEIPPDKISQFHEICDTYGFDVESVQFCTETKPKTKKSNGGKAGWTPTGDNSICALNDRRKPTIGTHLYEAYDSIKSSHGFGHFTYKQAGEAICKVLPTEKMSVTRRHLVTGGYIKIIKDA